MMPVSVQVHRDGCMCIICKQARRVGRTWGGMSSAADGAGGWQPPAYTGSSSSRRHKVQRQRFGKRAYVFATYQLVSGPERHKVSD